MTEEEVRAVVRMTVDELRRAGMLKGGSELAYAEAAQLIKAFYDDGETDETIKAVLSGMSEDPYIKVLPLYFSYGYTIERIAEAFHVEVSTIVRNKKRLCLQVYEAIQ